MTLPPRQSGRMQRPVAQQSSPRLAANYNLEHDPLASSDAANRARGEGFLRSLANGQLPIDRVSAIFLFLIIAVVLVIGFSLVAATLFKDIESGTQRDPVKQAAEAEKEHHSRSVDPSNSKGRADSSSIAD